MAIAVNGLRDKENNKFIDFDDTTPAVQTKSKLVDEDGNNITSLNPLDVSISSDIQIGAVEIKDHDGTDRAEVTAANALKVDNSAVTQPVSQSGDWDINDISKGTQTNDVKITLDGEEVTLNTPSGINGAPVTVGTTAVEMTFTGTTKSINLMSDADNTGKIWWGPSTIDNAGANAFGRLTPDRAVTIEFDDSSTAIYCCSDTAGQKVFKVCLT